MLKLFEVASTLSAANRGNYSMPSFSVRAKDADEAISIASKIVLCDRRTADGVLWTFAGMVWPGMGGDITSFSIGMKGN